MGRKQSYEELVREIISKWVAYTHSRTVEPRDKGKDKARMAFYGAIEKAQKRLLG